MSENARVRVTVSGRVQGVFFRANTVEQAVALGLAGEVRNMMNGNVEIIAEGNKKKIEKLIEWCRVGPPQARVDSVDVTWEEFLGKFTEFSVS
ncbi:MAG: acylphosphatase, partial [Nitrospinota bacterium]